ncbi:unnamed protein product [Brassica oleracea]
MDPYTETGSANLDSSSWPHASKSLPELLTEICQKAQRMLKLIKDGQPESTYIFLTLYQSLGESYNHMNQELLNGFLNFGFKPSSSDKNSVSFADLSSFVSHSSPSLEFDLVSGLSYSSLKLNDEAEKKDQSAYMLADFFSDELRTALRDLEERNRLVGELESKLSDSSDKIMTLERELDECHELLEVSEVEVSKLNEMLSERKTEKADDGGADLLLNTLRAELRSRDVQIEQMEEYLNQVCVKDTELLSDDESGTNKSVVEELKSRVEELENQVKKQSDVISEREKEKREAIRELCFSLDHYKSRYTELVISLSGNN